VAARIANGLAQNLTELAQGSSGIERPEGEVQLIDQAKPPTIPIAPQVTLIALLAAIAGLLGAMVLVLLIEYLGDAVRSPEELTRMSGAPYLGDVATASGSRGEFVAAIPSSSGANAYRVLTAKLELARGDTPLRSLAVVGTHQADGSGIVAANIALALASRRRRVALVDAMGVEEEITSIMGLETAPGLAEALGTNRLQPTHVRRGSGVEMDVLPTGAALSEVGRIEDVREILAGLNGVAEVTIVACRQVADSPATLLWARAVDAVVIVAPRDLARRPVVASTAASLGLVGANLIGAVLSDRRRRRRRRPNTAEQPPTYEVIATPVGPGTADMSTERGRSRARRSTLDASPGQQAAPDVDS
jgi:Mrp family chromosome partitioning ATPase